MESAEATASIVSAESHSAYASSMLGGSSSGRGSEEVALASPTFRSGFWLYANPMRVIPSQLVCAALVPPELRAARGVACSAQKRGAQEKCHICMWRKIRTWFFSRNDFLDSRRKSATVILSFLCCHPERSEGSTVLGLNAAHTL